MNAVIEFNETGAPVLLTEDVKAAWALAQAAGGGTVIVIAPYGENGTRLAKLPVDGLPGFETQAEKVRAARELLLAAEQDLLVLADLLVNPGPSAPAVTVSACQCGKHGR